MRSVKLIVVLFCLSVFAFGQSGNNQNNLPSGGPIPFAGVPSGSCSATQTAVNTTNGALYTCNAGSWQLATGSTALSGITGGTQGQPITGTSGGGVGSSPIFLDISKLSGADFCLQTQSALGQTTTLVYQGGGSSGATVPCSVNPFATFQGGLLQLPSSQILAQTLWSWGNGNGLDISGTGRGPSPASNTGAQYNTVIVSCHGQTGCNSNSVAPTGYQSTGNPAGTYTNQALFQEGSYPAVGFFGSQITHAVLDNQGTPGLMTFWDLNGQEQSGTSYMIFEGAGPYMPNVEFGGWDTTGNYGGGFFIGHYTPGIQNGVNLWNYETSYPGTKTIQGAQVTAVGASVTTCSVANAPAVTGNINATCKAITDANGALLFVDITNPGYGYTSVPAITLNGSATATAIPGGEGCGGGLHGIAATGITVTQPENDNRDPSNPNILGQATVTLAAAPPFTIYPNMTFRLDGFAAGATHGTVFTNTSAYDANIILTVAANQLSFTYLQPTPPAMASADSTGAGTITFVTVPMVFLSGADASNRGFGNGTININNGCGNVGTNNIKTYTGSAVAVSGGVATYTISSDTGAASNALAGIPFVVTGFSNVGNNTAQNTQTFIATGSTATTITFTATSQAAETHAGTLTIASLVNNGEAQIGTEVSTGQTEQVGDHIEGAVVGNGVGEMGPSQGYISFGNNPANIINSAAHLSARYGIPLSAVFINECSGGNSGVQGNMKLLTDDGNFNILHRANGRCIPFYATDTSNAAGGVFTLSNPNSGADVVNGVSVYAGSIDIWKGTSVGNGVNMFHADYSTGAVKPTLYQSQTNCAVNSASPAVCGSAPTGAFVVPTTTAAYTVNTTAATTTSRIFLQPLSFASNLPSSPTCVTPAVTSVVTVSAISNGVSFSIALPSTTGQTCWQYWIVN